MFDKDTLEKNDLLRKKREDRCEKLYKGRETNATTASGIPVKPVFMPNDINNIEIDEIGIPGEYPYIRGIYPLHYQFQPWMNQFTLGYGLPEQTRERMKQLRDEGMSGYFNAEAYNIVHDLVSKTGCDPDDPMARGLVGQGGVSVCTMNDIDQLFNGINLENAHIVQNIGSATMAGLAMLIVYAQDKGFTIEIPP